jgi:hypothetical protein
MLCSTVSVLLAACGPETSVPEEEARQTAALATPCGATKIAEVLAEPTAAAGVEVNCSLTLPPGKTVYKRLYFTGSDASGVTLDCNGSVIDHRKGTPGEINNRKDSILIRSVPLGPPTRPTGYLRPTDITIKNCTIYGAIRVKGMAHNGQGATEDGSHEAIYYSSRQPDHTARARAAAPTRITFREIKVIADHRTPFYLAPGVTATQLVDSELGGSAVAAAVYLDAESAYNTLRGNKIYTERTGFWNKRELISIDGSSHNSIVNNWFSELGSGGIYIYRNCGEEGVVRHAWPAHNQIINNVFHYPICRSPSAAILLGAKDGLGDDFFSIHCRDDDDSPYGSGADDADYARYNVVMQNQIYNRPPCLGGYAPPPIQQHGDKNKPNYIDHNEMVQSAIDRKAGCYLPSGYLTDFVVDGAEVDVFRGADGEPECRGYKYRCVDGVPQQLPTTTCSLSKVTAGCSQIGSDAGCSRTLSCPAGKRVIAARAACNLEWGTVSSAQLGAVPINKISVVLASDTASGSFCRLHGTSLTSGTKSISALPAGQSVSASCAEHDANGGDCSVLAQVYCAP